MKEQLMEILKAAEAELSLLETQKDLEAARIKYLGIKGRAYGDTPRDGRSFR